MNHLIVICGPTAVGKTKVAIDLANAFSTEILSCDARQFYKEMSIGTAKPTVEELAAAKHHFINTLSIAECYSAGQFEKDAITLLEQIFLEKNVAIMAGGSGLFIKAVCEGFDSLPQAPQEIRDKLNERLLENGIEFLQEKLKQKDPEYYTKVDLQNPQRLIRALEVIEFTGKSFSSFLTKPKKHRNFKPIYIGLEMDRAKLYEKINWRVDKMIETGLIDEVKSLYDKKSYNALNTVGYEELFDHFEGKTDMETAVELIKRNTRRYAKRQFTWFRKIEGITWFESSEIEKIIEHVKAQMQS